MLDGMKKLTAAAAQAQHAYAESQKPSHWLYTDVDTKLSHFDMLEFYPVMPRLFTTMFGEVNHWRTRGAHILHRPTRRGFRVYIEYDRMVTAELANRYKWTLQWIGTASRHSGISSNDKWKPVQDSSASHPSVDGGASLKGRAALGMELTINTKPLGFGLLHTTPAYVSSVYTEAAEWLLSGAAALYAPTPQSFRIYLQYSNDVSRAKMENTRVAYLGYQGRVDCAVSKWGAWSKCPCGNQENEYFQSHTRKILRKPEQVRCPHRRCGDSPFSLLHSLCCCGCPMIILAFLTPQVLFCYTAWEKVPRSQSNTAVSALCDCRVRAEGKNRGACGDKYNG